jgi:hypothetical protein
MHTSKAVRMFISAVVFPAVTLGAMATEGGAGLKIEFGATTLRSLLYKLGPSYSIYLSGHDSEGSDVKEDDPIVLQYEDKCERVFGRACSLFIAFEGERTVAVSWSVLFHPDSRPLATDLVRDFGFTRIERVRVAIVEDVEGLSSSLGSCASPDGETELWLSKGVGGKLILAEDRKTVVTMEFSEQLLSGRETYPPCEDSRSPSR